MADPAPFQQGINTLNSIRTASGVRDFASITEFVQVILVFVLGFLALVAFLVLVYGGALFLLSGGNEDKTKSAKKVILYAIIGLLIIGFSALIVNVVISIIANPVAPVPVI